MERTVLVVDDEKNIRRTLRMILESEQLRVEEAADAESALARVSGGGIDLAIVDLKLPNMGGLDLLRQMRAQPELANVPAIVISGHAAITEAVEAIRIGATDYFEKPLDRDRILVSVRNALRTSDLVSEVSELKRSTRRYEMIGNSPAIRELFATLEKVAPTKSRVLITGPSGSGKELVARAIHEMSDRRHQPFVKVNCAAIPGELIESELFGYEKGAFTGAVGRKRGFFELAHKGTIFLDEVGDMSLSAQAKVLRVLQSGELIRVGSETATQVDVRTLAATNRNLETSVAEGAFREDLYFRLNVIRLHVPPLAERIDDIPLLAQGFVEEFCREHGVPAKRFLPEALEALRARPWPGNVRELKNVIERMVILGGEELRARDIPAADSSALGSMIPDVDGAVEHGALHLPAALTPDGRRLTLREFRDAAERAHIEATLSEVGWNISRAAALLGIERTNLHKKMRSLGLARGPGSLNPPALDQDDVGAADDE